MSEKHTDDKSGFERSRRANYDCVRSRTERLARNRLYFAAAPKPHQCPSFADYREHAEGVRQQVLSGADALASASEANILDDNYIKEGASLI